MCDSKCPLDPDPTHTKWLLKVNCSDSAADCMLLFNWCQCLARPNCHERRTWKGLNAYTLATASNKVVYLQHCPPGRFLILMAVAALIYLTGLTPLRQMLQRLANVNQLQPGRPAPAGAANQPAPAAAQQWTFLAELQAVVVGFISSLIPGENVTTACIAVRCCLGACLPP